MAFCDRQINFVDRFKIILVERCLKTADTLSILHYKPLTIAKRPVAASFSYTTTWFEFYNVLMTFSSIYIYCIKKVSKPILETVRDKIKF